MKNRGWNIILISSIIFAVLLILGYFLFLYAPACSDKSCFENSLKGCSRASYINDDANAIWQYRILLSLGNECRINVKAAEIKSDAESQAALKGKEMLCSIPKPAVEMPEKRLEYCHGDLKESMQDLMIKRMQLYIINSLNASSAK